MTQTTTTGTRTSKGDVIALYNGATYKGATVTVDVDGQTVTGKVTSGWFTARFGPNAGRPVVFVRPTGNSRSSRPSSRPRTGGRFSGGGRCGNIWYNSPGDHEQNCNNPAC